MEENNKTEQKDYSEIYINLKEKTFSIKGNANFVKDSFESIRGIVVALKNEPELNENEQDTKLVIKDSEKVNEKLDKYIKAGIYSIDENKVILHKRIIGKTNAEKMKNIALIAIYAKNDKLQSSELKELCERQACYDANNFAAIFKRDIENFMVKGKSQSQSWEIDLTVGGREKAEEILESMMNKDEK